MISYPSESQVWDINEEIVSSFPALKEKLLFLSGSKAERSRTQGGSDFGEEGRRPQGDGALGEMRTQRRRNVFPHL